MSAWVDCFSSGVLTPDGGICRPQMPPSLALDREIEFMRTCGKCIRKTRFVAKRVCGSGLMGKCSVCGDEAIAEFTRTNSQ